MSSFIRTDARKRGTNVSNFIACQITEHQPECQLFEYDHPRFTRTSDETCGNDAKVKPIRACESHEVIDKLSALNAARFEEWKPNHDVDGLSPAIFAFDGDVYRGLDAQTLDARALTRLADRVRILSGLYGLLRPFDALRPYRLEMGTKLKGETIQSLPISGRQM